MVLKHKMNLHAFKGIPIELFLGDMKMIRF